MSLPQLSGRELVAWVERTASGWREMLASHPEALAFACDIRETTRVGELLQHIVAVELRYAERLCEMPQTSYADIPSEAVESIFAVHDRAMGLLFSLEDHEDLWWRESIKFETRSAGTMRAPRQVIFVHALTHSIRHFAQLATIVRKHGIRPEWMMDYLDMRPAELDG